MATAYQFERSCWPAQSPITGSWTTLHFQPYPSRRTKPTSKFVALTDSPVPVSAPLDVFKFRESADGEPNNLHSAQPELLLQLLQVLQIAFQKSDSGGLNSGCHFVGHPTYSNSSRCSDKASGHPDGNLRIPFAENFGNSRFINELSAYDSRTLLLQLLFALVSQDRHTFAILDYLASAELAEEDVWLRDDIRIAWITVLYASQGNPIPHVEATYRVLGIHPDKVYAAMLARDKALLGTSPKKPTESVKERAYAAKQGSVL